MSLANPPAAGTASLQRLEQIRKEIAAQRAATSRATAITTVFFLVILAILGYSVFWLSNLMAEFTEPKALVNLGANKIEDNLPELRKSLEQEVKKSAPVWAASASKQMRENMPKIREALEDQALSLFEDNMKQMTQISREQFSAFLKDNKPLLKQKFERLAKNGKLAEEDLKEVEEALDKQMKEEMKAKAKEFLLTLRSLNEKLAKLSVGKGLNEEEKLQRQALMIARRLQLEETDPSLAGKALPGVAEPFVKPEPPKPAPEKDKDKAPPPKDKDKEKTAPPKDKDKDKAAPPKDKDKTTPPKDKDK